MTRIACAFGAMGTLCLAAPAFGETSSPKPTPPAGAT